MTPSQWRRVRDVFERLVDLDAEDARRMLDADVTDDETVRLEVLSLLDQHSRADPFSSRLRPSKPLGIGSDLKPGAAVGPYTVVREIGHGGMGRVYLADDTRLQRHVCVKVVREDLSGDAQFRERLKREARLAASLSHPGICAVYALEEFDGHIYLVTEFVEGRTLREEMQSSRLPSAAEVLHTMKEIAAALAAAHAKGITHRDLKPENVMRSASGRLKILDFGLARTDGEPVPGATATLPGVVVGTPAYMAPEQITGGPVDRRADLFAFGVVMYEYAAGQHPFASPSPLGVAAASSIRRPARLRTGARTCLRR
jgi:serine/threonine protein kinase